METRIKSLFVIIVAFFFALAGCSGGGTTGTGGFSYSGKVVRQDGTPYNGLTVVIETPSGDAIAATSTSGEGSFEFSDVPTSDAVIRLERGPSESSEITVSVPKGSRSVRVSLKENNQRRFEREREDESDDDSRQDARGRDGSDDDDDSDSSRDDDSDDGDLDREKPEDDDVRSDDGSDDIDDDIDEDENTDDDNSGRGNGSDRETPNSDDGVSDDD